MRTLGLMRIAEMTHAWYHVSSTDRSNAPLCALGRFWQSCAVAITGERLKMALGVFMLPFPFRWVRYIQNLAVACLVPIAVALGTAGPLRAQAQLPREYTDLVGKSGFIFQGTVREIGGATKGIQPQANTAIVAVDVVFEALPP